MYMDRWPWNLVRSDLYLLTYSHPFGAVMVDFHFGDWTGVFWSLPRGSRKDASQRDPGRLGYQFHDMQQTVSLLSHSVSCVLLHLSTETIEPDERNAA